MLILTNCVLLPLKYSYIARMNKQASTTVHLLHNLKYRAVSIIYMEQKIIFIKTDYFCISNFNAACLFSIAYYNMHIMDFRHF